MITYVEAVEGGNYPDARIQIIEGGPGFSSVLMRLTRGPLGGFDYKIMIHGKELVEGEGSLRIIQEQSLKL